MKEVFDVTGMSCAACQANVTKAVAKLDGINDVDVSLLANRMNVDYDESIVNEKQICDAVAHIGYGASPKVQKEVGKSSMKSDWEARQARVEAESKAAKQRLIQSIILMIVLMYIAMGEMLHLPMPAILSGEQNAMISTIIQALLATYVIFIQRHFYIDGFKGLIRRAPNMDTLVALGSSASYIYALAMTFIMAYGLGHGQMMMVHQAHHSLYFDSSAMILTLVSIGKYLESKSKAKTGDALGKLMDLTPKNATVIRNGQEVEVASESIVAGDIVVMKPGQRVPVDGTITQGVGYLDQSAITGESIPVEKQVGDDVISATINENGTFQFRANRVGDDTTLAQIVRLVDEAGTSKAPIARIADKVAGIFVPVVMGIALLTFVGWMIYSGDFQHALNNGISVLVISCPCALGLATPMAIMVGTEKAARYGILLKSAVSLENLHNIDTIVLDKTGTITEGKPTLQDLKNFSDYSDEELLQVSASIENGSMHPLGQAIVQAAKDKGLSLDTVTNFVNVTGRGVKGTINGKLYLIGNAAFMKEENIAFDDQVSSSLSTLANEGKTPMILANDDVVLGVLAVADTVRTTSLQAIQAFKEKGIHVVMLTGDNKQTAQAVAKRLGVDKVISDVLPQDKEEKVRQLHDQGRFVAMVGDGINDAPALVRADVGIAIGAGTDIAMDSADVILMKNSLLDVNTAIDLSKATIRNVHQNLFWAFFYNAICIPAAMGLTGWTMSPMIGALAMSLSSICVCTNAWRLRFFKEKIVAQQEETPKPKVSADVVVEEAKPQPEEHGDPVTMSINGMMCDHCKARVTQALENIDGVSHVQVNVEENKADFEVNSTVSDDQLKEAITNAGYEPVSIERSTETVVLPVEGMMCEHCVKRVNDALASVAGVDSVHVDLDKAQAEVTMKKETKIDALKAAVENAGYTVKEA